ncbi:hypothetical protein OJ998_22600 [Solirubrobacter taibaiensis]|nr:hypothetical protein [Solirubrobacter taibaiensis]
MRQLADVTTDSLRVLGGCAAWPTTPDWTLAYTGDTGADPALSELSRDADLFIVDATDHHQAAATPDERFNLPTSRCLEPYA